VGSQYSQHRLAPVDAQAWDPETEYAMHRLREELLAVKQAEHDADANSDDPMDIDDEAPVHAQLAKELEMRSPSGAAASRMETEAPSPAASCSAASTYSSST